MGIDHGLINHKNHTLFNLAKGPFSHLRDQKELEILCDNDLRFDLLYSYYDKEEKPDQELEEYIRWMSDKIGKFIGDASLCDIVYHSDCTTTDDEYIDCKYNKGYLNAGSRFKADYNGDEFIGDNNHLSIYKRNEKKNKLKEMGYLDERKEYLFKDDDGKDKLCVIYKTYDLLDNGEVEEKITKTIIEESNPGRMYWKKVGTYWKGINNENK